MVRDIISAAWTLLWCEYLHHGNWQTIHSSDTSPDWILNVSQYNAGLSPSSRGVRPEEGDGRRKPKGQGAGGLHTSTFWLALPSFEWHILTGLLTPCLWSWPLSLNTALHADFWKLLVLYFSWWSPYLPSRSFFKEVDAHSGFVWMLCCMTLLYKSRWAVLKGLEGPHSECT